MKKLLLFLSIILSVSFGTAGLSCNEKKEKTDPLINYSHSDTGTALGVFLDGFDHIPKYGEMRRVSKNIFGYKDVDSTTKKKMWYKDTLYLIIHLRPVDSVLSAKYKIPILDSTGKQNTIPLSYEYSKEMVKSGWENLDSSIAQLKRLIDKP